MQRLGRRHFSSPTGLAVCRRDDSELDVIKIRHFIGRDRPYPVLGVYGRAKYLRASAALSKRSGVKYLQVCPRPGSIRLFVMIFFLSLRST